MPDIMYEKIKKRWKAVTKCDDYNIVKRTGGPKGKDDRRGKELIFCWKKMRHHGAGIQAFNITAVEKAMSPTNRK